MWHVLKVAAVDTGKLPLIQDMLSHEGSDLMDLIAWQGVDLHSMICQLRGTDLAFLEGWGYLTVEVQKWASRVAYRQRGEVADAKLRAMTASVQQLLSSGSTSPKTSTGTVPKGFSPRS